jgi:transcriptional regulator with XRE-family HTH domain
MKLGMQIRTARKKRGITQQELAGRIGMALPTIWSLENDKTQPDFSTVVKVVAELGMTVELNEGGKLVTVASTGKVFRAAKGEG